MNRKLLITLAILTTLTLTGCTTKEQQEANQEAIKQTTNQLSQDTGVPAEKIEKTIKDEVATEKSIQKPTETTPTSPTKETTQVKDEKSVVRYFEEKEEEVKDATESGNKAEIKEKATEYLTVAVGFLFEGEAINGITLKELSDESKKEIVESFNDTKEVLDKSGATDIAVKFGKEAKEVTFDILVTAGDIIVITSRDILGPELYEKTVDVLKEAGDRIDDAYHDVKSYLLKKYR